MSMKFLGDGNAAGLETPLWELQRVRSCGLILDSLFTFFIVIFIFSIIAGLQCSVNFLLYSMVTQLHVPVYILFSHIIMLHPKCLDTVPSAIQQDLIALSIPKAIACVY